MQAKEQGAAAASSITGTANNKTARAWWWLVAAPCLLRKLAVTVPPHSVLHGNNNCKSVSAYTPLVVTMLSLALSWDHDIELAGRYRWWCFMLWLLSDSPTTDHAIRRPACKLVACLKLATLSYKQTVHPLPKLRAELTAKPRHLSRLRDRTRIEVMLTTAVRNQLRVLVQAESRKLSRSTRSFFRHCCSRLHQRYVRSYSMT